MDFIAHRMIDGLRCLLNLSFENICEPLYRRSQRRRPFAYVRIVFITQRVVPDSQRCFQVVFHRAQTLFQRPYARFGFFAMTLPVRSV